MGASPVIVGVTAGTIRLISWRWPGNGLAIAGMAAQAGWVCRMVTRVVAGTVAEINRCPVAGVMAAVALQGGAKMIARLTSSGSAIVATGAATIHFRMVHPGYRRPGRCAMAGLAGIGRQDMCRILAGCGAAVVTTKAGAGNGRVIHARA